jgi:O-antigen biosynthesis protein WbqV
MHGKRPDIDIRIDYTGLRPGEKLFEELLTGESGHHTDIPDITVAKGLSLDRARTAHRCASLLEACERRDLEGLTLAVKALVPEWTPSERYQAILV